MATIFFVAMVLIFFFENLNFVTKMCFKHKKLDVTVILSEIQISLADRLKQITTS